MDTKTLKKLTRAPTTTCNVAPEDLRRGDYVAVMQTTHQFVVYNDKGWEGVLKTLTVRLMPFDEPEAYRVRAVCLPFVFTRVAGGGHRTLDLRRHEIRRLDQAFGKLAFRSQRDKDADTKSGKRKKSRKRKRKRRKKGK